jgi:hypothetical protein
MFGESSTPRAKRKLDTVFVLHAASAALVGCCAFLFPQIFGLFFNPEGFSFHPKSEERNVSRDANELHLVIRMYGALVMAQAWLVWNARQVQDAHMRRTFIQAYFGCFALTTIALLHSQLQELHFHWLNWINILLFAGLSSMYAYFACVEPIVIFQGPAAP